MNRIAALALTAVLTAVAGATLTASPADATATTAVAPVVAKGVTTAQASKGWPCRILHLAC